MKVSYKHVTGGVAEIDLEIGTEILRIAFAEEQFGIHIPTTDREWDAYSIPD